jgi:hypothetical protein
VYSDNYLEIILTSIGWEFYGKIVYMIYSLNLHLLPIVFVMFQNWRNSVTSSSYRAGYQNEMNNNFFDVGIMMLVIMLFWLPNSATKFDAPVYIQNIQSVSNDPGSSAVFINAQNAMGVSSTAAINIPPGWYIMVNGTKAAINQLKEWMVFTPTATTMLTVFNNLKIEDDEVRAESDLFYSQCYIPALKRYQNATKPVPNLPAEDANYIGNNVFINTPGLYKACTQSDIDNGTCLGDPLTMPFTSAKKYGIPTRFTDTSTTTSDGRALTFSSTPSCHQWWTGDFDQHYFGGTLPTHPSLKDKIFDQAAISGINTMAKDPSITTPITGIPAFLTWVQSATGLGSSETKDRSIRKMLSIDPPALTADPDDLYAEPEGIAGTIKGGIQKVYDLGQGFLGGVGAAITSLTLGVVLEVLKPALQMIQAGMIFAVLLYMAITLPIGGFSAETVIKHGMVILGILMLSFIWHVADLLNEGLIRILYPGATSLMDLEISTSGFVFQIWLFVLYMLLPSIFLFMMKTAGQEVAEATDSMMSSFKSAGKKGASKVPTKMPKGK